MDFSSSEDDIGSMSTPLRLSDDGQDIGTTSYQDYRFSAVPLKPISSLNEVFRGLNSYGKWTLVVDDQAGGDEGHVMIFRVNIQCKDGSSELAFLDTLFGFPNTYEARPDIITSEPVYNMLEITTLPSDANIVRDSYSTKYDLGFAEDNACTNLERLRFGYYFESTCPTNLWFYLEDWRGWWSSSPANWAFRENGTKSYCEQTEYQGEYDTLERGDLNTNVLG